MYGICLCHRSARLPRQPITTHSLTWILMEHTCSLSSPHHHTPYKLTPHHSQMSDLVPMKWTHSKLSKLLTCSLPDIINLLSCLQQCVSLSLSSCSLQQSPAVFLSPHEVWATLHSTGSWQRYITTIIPSLQLDLLWSSTPLCFTLLFKLTPVFVLTLCVSSASITVWAPCVDVISS